MFRPPPAVPEDTHKEWIELYNAGGNAVDLANWSLAGAVMLQLPHVVVGPQEYLVVAADRQVFTASYPLVTNVVGNWTGKLGNNGDEIELRDPAGQKIDTVRFSNEGDWALRREGDPYPGKPDWWAGWKWQCLADGQGSSLELMHPGMPNQYGQSWRPSQEPGGTPGRANSVFTTAVAPLILEVKNLPAVPRSTSPVTVSARVIPVLGGAGPVRLFWKLDGAATFSTQPMLDDGLNGDGLANDGVYGTLLPAQADKAIVEFYLEAQSAAGPTRTWPGPTDDGGGQLANALYQVDDFSYAGSQPLYRFIVTEHEWSNWVNLMDNVSGGRFSNAEMNGTLVRVDSGGTEVRYCVGLRNRGAGTRTAQPHNLSLSIPADRDLRGMARLDFNTRTVHSQVAGNAVFSAAGLLNSYGAPVQVRINARNLAHASPDGSTDSYQFGSYYCFEPYSSAWGRRHVPQDPGGNIYKGVWYLDTASLVNAADLQYLGTNVSSYRLAYGPDGPVSTSGPYDKESNRAQDNWTDLIRLTYVLSSNTPDVDYLPAVEQVMNVEQWLRHIAAHSLILNMETTLATGTGDDYSSYNGATDPRFQLLPHDFDTVLGAGENRPSWGRSIFKAAELPVLNRLLKHPAIAPRYFSNLVELANTVFAPERLNPLLDQNLKGWVPDTYIEEMKAAGQTRRANVLAQIPRTLSVTSSLPVVNGYPRTTTSSVSLGGTGNAIVTRTLAVNGNPTAYTPWQGQWSLDQLPLQPGINRVQVQAFGTDGQDLGITHLDIWYDDANTQAVGGTLTSDTLWRPEDGPFHVTSSLNIGAGVTLTIQPGTTVFLGSGVNITVANGGRLLAEGSATQRIRFSTLPGSSSQWGGLTINGGPGSPESRIVHAFFEGNATKCIQVAGGTLYLAHTGFGNTSRQYLSLDGSSFLVEECHFPTATAAFELVHGAQGIKAGGRGIFRKCFFGAANGYNDVIDFTGGNRDTNEPILQVYDCVFVGSGDDLLDLDGTDAWIEGNIFLNVHRNGAPDSSSAVSGGSDGARTSEVTVLRNFFFNCDHAATAKQGNFYTLLQNTIVRTTKAGGQDEASAVVNLQDVDPTPTVVGRGIYLEGNLVVDAEALTRNYDPAQVRVTFTNNMLPLAWTGPGGGNLLGDPLFVHIPTVEEAAFTNWHQAQVVRQWFGLREGSPALDRGAFGQDLGAAVSSGVFVSAVPPVSASTTAHFEVGPRQTAYGIPAAGFPEGSGYPGYRWRLDDGPWSPETPTSTPILLSGLAEGPHRLEVSGKNDAGQYQDSPALGPDAKPTELSWRVDTISRRVILNEILCDNQGAAPVDDRSPDLIELHNPSAGPVDLAGLTLTDNASVPGKYVFPPGAPIPPGSFHVLLADGQAGTNHTSFSLNRTGGEVYLFDAPARGGGLLDRITYGPQLPNYSIGRRANGTWGLMLPSFGAANDSLPTAGPLSLRLNEWLAFSASAPDFIEIFNPEPVPADAGGCFLSDAPAGFPARSALPPLSFIAPRGYLVLLADAQTAPGHVTFRLDEQWGALGFFAPDLAPIDLVVYGPQASDISMGRTPDGGPEVTALSIPTPGSGNPYVDGSFTVTNITVSLMKYDHIWRHDQTHNLDGQPWSATDYNDGNWSAGPGLLAFETASELQPLIRTVLNDPRTSSGGLSGGHAFYFRSTVMVTNDLSVFSVNGRMRLDDGAVLYVNGTEVARPRMRSTEVITNLSFATGSPGSGDALVDESFSFPGSLLQPGTNIIAAEVHQVNATSSDIVWGLELTATQAITNWIQRHIVLNEVMAHSEGVPLGDGTVCDWIELYNPGSAAADLSGLVIRGDPSKPSHQWTVPPGVDLERGAHLLIRFDPDAAPSTNAATALNTGFGIDAEGETIFLYSGGSLLDAVAFGPQAANFSIARLPDGTGAWQLALPTPEDSTVPAPTGDPSLLRVNEWMADPASGDDWFELYNLGSQPVALGGLCLTDDLNRPRQFVIPPLSFIGSGPLGGYLAFQADGNPTNGPTHTSFRLSAGGETIGIFSADAATRYDFVSFVSQSEGVSEGRFPNGSPSITRFPRSPTPGNENYLAYYDVFITEVDASPLGGGQSIELRNQTDQTVDLSGAWISDDLQVPKKFRLPDPTILEPGEFLVIPESNFNPLPGGATGFRLDALRGGSVYLSLTLPSGELTGYRTKLDYPNVAPHVSAGLHETATGFQAVAMNHPTLGSENAGPAIGPVVISEIHYHPPNVGTNDNTTDEFIELMNVTATNVPLYFPQQETNTWHLRNGVTYDFPASTTLAAGGTILVVSFDPVLEPGTAAQFRQKFGIPPETPVLGPWRGKLDNGGEKLELNRPVASDLGGTVRIIVDQLNYSDQAPWPSATDGFGSGTGISLQRVAVGDFGNDPVNWIAGMPTAGRPNGPAAGLIPTLTVEPASQLAAPGTFLSLHAAAAGTSPLSFQWRFQGMELPGETNASLFLSSLKAADEGRYSVWVSNPFGCLRSTNAPVRVLAAPSLTRQPLGGTASSAPFTFAAVAHGTFPLHYQWYKDGQILSGATRTTLTLPAPHGPHAGTYQLVASNNYGSATSVLAILSTDVLDSDNDGTPDGWMLEHFGHSTGQPGDESMAGEDPDRDGLTNLEEYLAGTDPLNVASTLRIAFTTPGPDGRWRFAFQAVQNRAYIVEQRGSLLLPWVQWMTVPAGTARTVQFEVHSPPAQQQYYRVTTTP